MARQTAGLLRRRRRAQRMALPWVCAGAAAAASCQGRCTLIPSPRPSPLACRLPPAPSSATRRALWLGRPPWASRALPPSTRCALPASLPGQAPGLSLGRCSTPGDLRLRARTAAAPPSPVHSTRARRLMPPPAPPCCPQVSLINVEGTGMVGVPGTAAAIFRWGCRGCRAARKGEWVWGEQSNRSLPAWWARPHNSSWSTSLLQRLRIPLPRLRSQRPLQQSPTSPPHPPHIPSHGALHSPCSSMTRDSNIHIMEGTPPEFPHKPCTDTAQTLCPHLILPAAA